METRSKAMGFFTTYRTSNVGNSTVFPLTSFRFSIYTSHLRPHGAKASISGAAVSVEPDCHGVAGAGEGSWDGVATELLIIPFHTIPFVDHLHII